MPSRYVFGPDTQVDNRIFVGRGIRCSTSSGPPFDDTIVARQREPPRRLFFLRPTLQFSVCVVIVAAGPPQHGRRHYSIVDDTAAANNTTYTADVNKVNRVIILAPKCRVRRRQKCKRSGAVCYCVAFTPVSRAPIVFHETKLIVYRGFRGNVPGPITCLRYRPGQIIRVCRNYGDRPIITNTIFNVSIVLLSWTIVGYDVYLRSVSCLHVTMIM